MVIDPLSDASQSSRMYATSASLTSSRHRGQNTPSTSTADASGAPLTRQSESPLNHSSLRGAQYPSASAYTVVATTNSLLGQWQDELKKFAPRLKVLVYHSSGDKNKIDKMTCGDLRDVDVILAEVGAIEDHVFLMKHEADESQKRRREQNKARSARAKAQGRGGSTRGDEPPPRPGQQQQQAASAAPRRLGRAARILEKRGKDDAAGGGEDDGIAALGRGNASSKLEVNGKKADGHRSKEENEKAARDSERDARSDNPGEALRQLNARNARDDEGSIPDAEDG